MFSRVSLGSRLNLLIITVNLTILFLVAFLANSSVNSALRQQAISRFKDKSDDAFFNIESQLSDFHDFATTLATGLADFENISSGSGVNAYVLDLIEENISGTAELVYSVSVLRPDGSVIWMSHPATERTSATSLRVISSGIVDDTPLFQTVRNAETEEWFAQDVAVFDIEEAETITVSIPYQHAEGAGVVLVDMLKSDFGQQLINALGDNGLLLDTISGYIIILDDNNALVNAENLNAQVDDLPENLSLLDARLNQAPLTNDDLLQINDPFNNNLPGLVNVRSFSITGWQFFAMLPVSEIPALPGDVYMPIGLVGIPGIIVLIIAVNRFIENSVVKPLVDLGRSASEIGEGNLRFIVFHKDKPDEIGRLANAMDTMRSRLRDSYNELETWGRTLEDRVEDRTVQLRDARKEAERNAQQIQVVYDGSLSVVNETQLQPVLDAFIDRILLLLDARYCAVWLLNKDRQEAHLVATNDVRRRTGTGLVTMDAGLGIIGQAMTLDQPIIVNDYENYEHRVVLNDHYQESTIPFNRGVCAPLKFAGFAIGAVVVGRDADSPPFDLEAQHQLTLFTNMVSPSVRNAQLFARLQEAVREAERANEVKTRFLASVTHELRTPLNLIINNVDFMRVGSFGEVTDEQVSRLNQTVRSAEHLLYLINDLLDVSKIDAGEMQLFIQKQDVYTMLEDAVDNAYAMLDNYDEKVEKVELYVEIEDDLPEVPMDARRIRQVLNNLLSNAIKFTTEGTVTLKVFQDSDGIHFSVHDTGMGIPQDEMKKLFLAFERTNAAKQNAIEGTGLGLPISRYMVQKHGSDLTVTSDVGVGSTFAFTISFEIEKVTEQNMSDTQQVIALLSNKDD